MNIWRTGSEAPPTRREHGSFYFKDVRGSRPALSRMPDIAVSYLRSFPSPIPVERDPYGIYRMALHFPRWSEIIDMDGCSKTFCLVVSVVLCIYYIASSLHLNFSGLVSTISDSDFSKTFFLTMSTTNDISSNNSWQVYSPLLP